MNKIKGLYILEAASFGLIYGPDERRDIAERVDIYESPQTRESIAANRELLAPAEVVFSGWSGPRLDEEFLDAAPNLKAIFYGAGAMGYMLTPAVWERGIVVTSAITANSIPVAEYTLATILFSLKHGWRLARQTRAERRFPPRDGAPGCYGRTVGLVSLGSIARILLRLLEPFELDVLVYDPYLSDEQAEAMGVTKASLETVFRDSDVLSIHTPLLEETEGMITGEHIASMKEGATLINTARGAVVREEEMIEVLLRRPDLQAVLDVTADEPPHPHSPLYDLENVVLTPHIAGSVGRECRRMGRYMVEELERYLSGQPLKWAITEEMVEHSSNRPMTKVPRALVTA